MKYARIIDWVAVDVVSAPPATLFTPEVAAQFTVVPDIEQGSVLLPVLVNEAPTADRAWQPPRSYLEEYAAGKWRIAQRDAAPTVTFAVQPPTRRLTKRSFWNRFPTSNEIAMRAVILTGSPALLAASLQRLQARVDASPYVDLDLPETQQGVNWLASVQVPATVTIDGTTLPLRLTADEAAAVLNGAILPTEVFKE